MRSARPSTPPAATPSASRVRDPEVYRLLEEAHWRVLRAETSCNFFWGQAWLQRCHDDLDQATRLLNQAGSRLA